MNRKSFVPDLDVLVAQGLPEGPDITIMDVGTKTQCYRRNSAF